MLELHTFETQREKKGAVIAMITGSYGRRGDFNIERVATTPKVGKKDRRELKTCEVPFVHDAKRCLDENTRGIRHHVCPGGVLKLNEGLFQGANCWRRAAGRERLHAQSLNNPSHSIQHAAT